jgi:hypothetical protein
VSVTSIQRAAAAAAVEFLTTSLWMAAKSQRFGRIVTSCVQARGRDGRVCRGEMKESLLFLASSALRVGWSRVH